MPISNETRAERAEAAMCFYVEAKGETFENSSSEIVDLIADLLHLTARLDEGDEPIESTLRLARMHFEAETSNPEEQTMTTETTNEAATRKYSVLYAVTRGEYYEIEAANEEEAKDKAFTDGEFVEGATRPTLCRATLKKSKRSPHRAPTSMCARRQRICWRRCRRS